MPEPVPNEEFTPENGDTYGLNPIAEPLLLYWLADQQAHHEELVHQQQHRDQRRIRKIRAMIADGRARVDASGTVVKRKKKQTSLAAATDGA